MTDGKGHGDDNGHDEIGPEIHLHQEARGHRHNEKTQNGPFGPLMIFTSARHDEARFGQGLSETSLPLWPTSRGAVSSRFNPNGRLLNVVFFVYGQNRPKRREMLLRPLEADVVRHNRCRSHR